MIGEKISIEVELCGYRAIISRILVREALPPFHPEDQLLVVVEFDEPCPQAIISTAIAIPVKEYSREELLKVIKEEGDKQLSWALARSAREKDANEQRRQRRAELDGIARKAEQLLQRSGGEA